ncbi:hypothetical protein [Saccharopolyspora sp. 5N708]|uniref:hypothetical protein n=1 Tax=Saccharopolyspora sp. 5N708 TaxID=3457424 RepID=UPI003FD001D4
MFVLAAPMALGIEDVVSTAANAAPPSAMVLTDRGEPGDNDEGTDSGSDTDSSDSSSSADGKPGTD